MGNEMKRTLEGLSFIAYENEYLFIAREIRNTTEIATSTVMFTL